MKRKLFLLLAFVLLLSVALSLSALADEGSAGAIMAHNLYVDDHVEMIYYVLFDETVEWDDRGVLIFTEPKDSYTYENADAILNGEGDDPVETALGLYHKFYYVGLADYQMTDVLYACPFVTLGDETVYGKLDTYSVLQYAMEQTGKTGYDPNPSLAGILEWLLDEGAKAQIAEGYHTERLANADHGYLFVKGGTLPGGLFDGCFTVGSDVTLTGVGGTIGWYNDDGERIAGGKTYQVTVTAEPQFYTAVCEEHEFVEEMISAATCTEPARYRRVCACGAQDGEAFASGEALGHDLVHHDAKAATCTAGGWEAYDTCSRCDYSTYSELAALGHDLVHHDAKAATCTAIGWEAYDTCSRCDYTTYQEIAALGHNYEAVVTAPTCTAAGYTTHTCSRCGDSYVDGATEALGHNYEAVVTDPTCTAAGYTTHTCSRCGDSYVDSETLALGHDYEAVVTDPTCTAAGYTTHTCTRCGDSYVDTYVDALGHDYEVTLSTATCTAAGTTTYTCTHCGDSYAENVDALGHDFDPTTGICQNCGESNVIYVSNGDGTCRVTGLRTPTETYVVIAESSFDGDRVTSIAQNAFVGSSVKQLVLPKTLNLIAENAFSNVPLKSVYYTGNITEWDDMTMEEGNNPLWSADVYFYTGTQPNAAGYSWHWVDGVPTVWPDPQEDYGELIPLG